MQQKARMTFRFEPSKPLQPPSRDLPDGSGARKPEETPQAVPPDWYAGGPLQDDPQTLEEIIRYAGPWKPADKPASRPMMEPPPVPIHTQPLLTDSSAETAEWKFGPDIPSVSDIPPPKDGPPWWRVFASVGGAVATGALFGYLVLNLFTEQAPFGSKIVSGTAAPSQTAAPSETPFQRPQDAPAVDRASGGPASASVLPEEIPEATYYLLQFGVFNSEDGMNAALEELKAKGLPASADRTNGFRVYAGAAGTREEAQQLAGQMSAFEVFIKPMAEEAFRPDAAGGSPGLAGFMERSHALALELANLSIGALQDDVPGPVDSAKLADLRETHRSWLGTAGTAERLTGPAGDAGRALVQALNAAMVSVDDYDRKISRFHLWGVQARVMDAVLADRTLRSALRNVNP